MLPITPIAIGMKCTIKYKYPQQKNMVRTDLQFRNPNKDKGCGMIYTYCCGPFQWLNIYYPTKIHWKHSTYWNAIKPENPTDKTGGGLKWKAEDLVRWKQSGKRIVNDFVAGGFAEDDVLQKCLNYFQFRFPSILINGPTTLMYESCQPLHTARN